ncbi:metallophosphoesterase family protein [Chitinophagales bacterium]|nr:metallophosphoesterase family protein [Chitinophagales bacterium]
MKNIFFTSDHHFGHKNIIKFSNRPFDSVEEMDTALIQKWNEKVGPDDEVYHLGDVGLCSAGKLREILDQLNGKIYLIKGNHEKSAEVCSSRFEWIKDYHELVVKDPEFKKGQQMIVLFHYALREWNASHWGTYHLYGHSHGSLKDDPSSHSFDIGVDCHDFSPLSYEEVKAIMKGKDWVPPFGNGNR